MMTTKMVPWLDDCMNDKRLNWGIFFCFMEGIREAYKCGSCSCLHGQKWLDSTVVQQQNKQGNFGS